MRASERTKNKIRNRAHFFRTLNIHLRNRFYGFPSPLSPLFSSALAPPCTSPETPYRDCITSSVLLSLTSHASLAIVGIFLGGRLWVGSGNRGVVVVSVHDLEALGEGVRQHARGGSLRLLLLDARVCLLLRGGKEDGEVR